MSSATTIYWYSLGAGSLQTISLPFITDLDDTAPVVVSATSESTAGAMFRQHYGAWRRVTLVRQHLRYSQSDEKRAIEDLVSLQDHLVKGHSVGIAVGANKAWASIGGVSYPRGTTVVIAPANAYGAWSGSSNPQPGDELVLQSPEPEGAREVVIVDTVIPVGTSLSISFTYGTRYEHTGSWLLRHRHFYPALKLPEDQKEQQILLSSNRGRTVDLQMTLREDMPQIWGIQGNGQLAGANDTGWGNSPDAIQALGQRNRSRRPY